MTVNVGWTSHVPHDISVVELGGTDGSAMLRTTFGFSPDRLDKPSLVVRSGAGETDVALPPAKIGDEYDGQLAELARFARSRDGEDSHLEVSSGQFVVRALVAMREATANPRDRSRPSVTGRGVADADASTSEAESLR